MDFVPSETIELEKPKEIHYNCDECSSPIEILSINENENTIEFKCAKNNHQKKIKIKDYINKMKQYIDCKINNEKCGEHKEKYKSYCFDCKKHLCKECLKLRNHVEHVKIYIIEILPNKDELNMLENKIKYYENEITKLENEKISKMKFKDNKFKEFKEDEVNKEKDLSNQGNKDNKEKELKLKEDKNVNNMKKEYENDNENEIKQKSDLDKKIENLNYLKRLAEIIFNTYDSFNNNYYNAVNISNALDSYYKNKEDFNNKLNKDIKTISQIKNQKCIFNNIIKEGENQINGIEKFIDTFNELEGKIKNMKQDYEKKLQDKKEELNKQKIEYEKILNNDNNDIIINKKINYKDGEEYKGELKEFKIFKFHGNGKYVYKNGDIYEGEWKNGKKEGKGTLCYSNGDKYEGEWKRGKREGKGIFYYKQNKKKYDGEWKNDEKEGKGILYYTDKNAFYDRFEGIWEKNKKKKGIKLNKRNDYKLQQDDEHYYLDSSDYSN